MGLLGGGVKSACSLLMCHKLCMLTACGVLHDRRRCRRTRFEGNMAAEGGGLWTAWPMIIEDCRFMNNYALVSVRAFLCQP